MVDITKRHAGSEPVTETANPLSQLVNKTATLATMQRSATEVVNYTSDNTVLSRYSVPSSQITAYG